MINYLDLMNVYIEGDKSGFNSKIAVTKFKDLVKSSNEISVEELSKRFIKTDYNLELLSKDNSNIKFKLSLKQQLLTELHQVQEQEKKQIDTSKRELLRNKIRNMSQNRSNSDFRKVKNHDFVPDNIMKEYLKLKQASPVPIPEPWTVIENPEEYRTMIGMLLGNKMVHNNPFLKYFKLLGERIGVTEAIEIPNNLQTSDLPQNMQHLFRTKEILKVKSNEMCKADDDTDSD